MRRLRAAIQAILLGCEACVAVDAMLLACSAIIGNGVGVVNFEFLWPIEAPMVLIGAITILHDVLERVFGDR